MTWERSPPFHLSAIFEAVSAKCAILRPANNLIFSDGVTHSSLSPLGEG